MLHAVSPCSEQGAWCSSLIILLTVQSTCVTVVLLQQAHSKLLARKLVSVDERDGLELKFSSHMFT